MNVNKICSEYNFEIYSASYIGKPQNNTVMYITKKVERLLSNLDHASECLVFAENTISVPEQLKQRNCIVLCPNPQKEYAEYVSELCEYVERQESKRKYTLTDGGYYIGENVAIGNNAIIEPLCLIGHDVVIGNNARILAGAKIKRCIIGDYFIAGENCAIGTNGFTMARDDHGDRIRIPTLGKIIIGNHVEIGALTNISVGSAGNTMLCDHVKVDSLVHIGHDAALGKNVEITAGAIIGGFDELKDGVYIGINAVLRNRIVIGENAVIGMGAVATKSVDPSTAVVGNPAKPFRK